MEVVIRVFLFYGLEKVYNNITAVIHHPNCCSTTITTGNISLMYDEPTYCLADQSYLNPAKTNLVHVSLISMCMILLMTPRQIMRRTIKWLAPLMLMLGSLDYLCDLTIVFNKFSARALRFVTFAIVCYWIYQQVDIKCKPTQYKFRTLKWLIPLTLLFWSFDYFYNSNVTLSGYFLMTLRITTFLILSYSIYVIQQRNRSNGDKSTAIFFLFCTFGFVNAEFQYEKYSRLICIMHAIIPGSASNSQKKNSIIILFMCFVIDLACLNCDLQSLIEGHCLEEIYGMETVTIARVLIPYELLPYFNKLIFEAVQYKLLHVINFDLKPVYSYTMAREEFFTIDSYFLNLKNESGWMVLQNSLLINFGELFSNFTELTCSILIGANKGKKLLAKTLLITFFTVFSAILMLLYSISRFTFSVHQFIILCLSIYVIIFNVLSFSRYAVIEIKPFKHSVHLVNRAVLIEFFLFLIHCCLYIIVSISWFIIALSQRVVAIKIFDSGIIFAENAMYYIVNNRTFIMGFVKAKMFMYFIFESKPEVLKKLNDVCSICREEMFSACVTACNHHYHKHCLLSCLYDSNKCPLCKCELYSK